jgi:nicotinate-nucleotide adenylyltransferase
VKIGIFGGTFDPPHLGHLIAATDACELLGLDRLLFVPTASQPLKAGQPATDAVHRLRMVEALAALDPRFSVESMEVDRGGLSFTIDTLRALRQRWPAGTAELVLLLGADAAAQFAHWREPEAVLGLAEVVVLTRGEVSSGAPSGMRIAATRRVDISSTEIRERVRAGKPVRAFVPEAVDRYIASNGLYR